ncbi:Holliday junction resolvase RuvX [Xinfangfangia sp. D13-10-4-6]|uniref:Holliday junction resolvase RuvX n=1 Tax=Pseudogemmobacter hezensis TaxID=2737662 RepID=UPI001554CE66|nr:Holliday junction resolvase RuvX [Pseudogemmobacter hezensis]NPD13712.1 Holliday junction resolvase RuvX [Pseudogemmobacter hezensis]
MIFDDISTFATELPAFGAIAGLDLGTKTIGVALSDLRRAVATPTKVIRREKFTLDAAQLLELLAQREIRGIVLGLPLNMDGSEGPRVQSTRAFARNLEKLTPLPIGYWDERLSTVAAERALLEADASRKRRKEVIDAVAAGYILQGALDRLTQIARQDAGRDA